MDEILNTLIGFWGDVLGMHISEHDQNFFELGGDSMQMMTVIMNMNTAFKIEFTAGDFFDHPTLASMAEFVADMLANTQAERPVA